MTFRRALTVLAACTALVAVAVPSAAQDKDKQAAQEKKKLSKDEMTHYESLHSLVDAVASGKQPAPTEAKLVLHPFFLKSGQDIYIPFTLDIQPAFPRLRSACTCVPCRKIPRPPPRRTRTRRTRTRR